MTQMQDNHPPRSGKLTFRAPKALRNALRWGAKKLEISQGDFVTDAVIEFIDRVENNEPIDAFILPADFPTSGESEMVGIRVNPSVIADLDRYKPRFYQSRTRLILWATAMKALKLVKENKKRSQ